MDRRRLELLGLSYSRLRNFTHLVRKGRLRSAYSYAYSTALTRDAGLALADPLHRRFHSSRVYPRAIELEVTTRCNLRCRICEHTHWDEVGEDMSFGDFKHIVDQFPDLRWMGITGIGEQFLNPDFMDMLAYLKGRGVFVEFFNSGNMMTPERSRRLVELGVDKIWISMEAATASTYESTRVGARFERVVENVRELFRIKRELNSATPEVWFHYIVTTDNLHEAPDFVDLVADLASQSRNYATLIFWTSLLHFPEVEDLYVAEIPDSIREEVERRAARAGIYSNWNQNTTELRSVTQCTRWTEPFILVSGHVQPCCAINEANQRPYQRETAFANLLEEDFRDVWRSDRYRDFLATIRRGELPEPCKYCRLFVED